MASAFEFTLNGRAVRVADVSPNTTLLDFLRNSGLSGSKEGCAEGDCGACSVAIIERGADGKPTYRAVYSCIMPICLVVGREIVTVEGIGCAAQQHPVQQKMVEHLGSQCGYCTPGFICSMFEGYYRKDLHTHDDLDEQLAGNLCRCTGYRPIRDAAVEAFQCGVRNAEREIEDNFARHLQQSETKLGTATYENDGEKFLRPASLVELLALLKTNPDARLIAGATELGLEITKRFKKRSRS
jgi:xanthine dehydrogenase large subunit